MFDERRDFHHSIYLYLLGFCTIVWPNIQAKSSDAQTIICTGSCISYISCETNTLKSPSIVSGVMINTLIIVELDDFGLCALVLDTKSRETKQPSNLSM